MRGSYTRPINMPARAQPKSPAVLMVRSPREISDQDLVIVVIGPSGAGKSSFINIATEWDQAPVGHASQCGTSEVRSYRCFHPRNDRHIIFVDTPGFDSIHKSDDDILMDVTRLLIETQSNRIIGLLFLHHHITSTGRGSPLNNMKLIRKTWGPIAPQNVIIGTTMWDRINEEDPDNVRAVERWETFWKSMVPDSSQIIRFSNSHESAWSIVDQFISNRWVLQLQVGRGMEPSALTTNAREDVIISQRLEEYRRPERLFQLLSESNKLLVSARKPIPPMQSPENVDEQSQTVAPKPSVMTVPNGVGTIWMGKSKHSHHGSLKSKLSSLASSMTPFNTFPPRNTTAVRFEDTSPEHAKGSASDQR